ncbi:PREDICTED: uncharacterized protein LOC105556107 [Vollenhovia emeryi]|uniref:uncharacterized protein LOC105556107 n=1 Tax=Vollenhovia emeryi TaxID=411798 RepID=UPI0005F39E45|nr:PREDICTED: uncharacterized protein LOC105556107 [Vollenhovia emeryi]
MSTDKQQQYEELKRRRATTRSQLTKFKTFVEALDARDRASIMQMKIRLERAEALWDRFDETQGAIEALDNTPDFIAKQEGERTAFENAYYEVMTRARVIMAESEQPQGRRVSVEEEDVDVNIANDAREVRAGNVGTVRLPTMSLPTFNGTYEQWQAFHGPFSATIESIEITDGNYQSALDLLKRRYDNSRLATRHHIRAIFALKPVERETAVALRGLTDEVQQRLAALTALKEPTEHWSTIINEWILSKLDSVTSREWEEKSVREKLNKTEDLLEFLEAKCFMLESMSGVNDKRSNVKVQKGVSHVVTTDKAECKLCKGGHKLYACKVFNNMSVESRCAEVRRLGLCFNCLNRGHSAKYCKARHCKIVPCQGRHHSLLHPGLRLAGGQPTPSTRGGLDEASSSSLVACASQRSESAIILSTALVKIRDNVNEWREARALLDSGATLNFITAELCERLRLPEIRWEQMISGFNEQTTSTKAYVKTVIGSRLSNYEQPVKLIVSESITCPLPESRIDLSCIQIPESISLSNLADPRFNVPQRVDLLLGAGIFWSLLRGGRIRLSDSQPIFQNTHLGWILGGGGSLAGGSGAISGDLLQRDGRLDESTATEILGDREMRIKKVVER